MKRLTVASLLATSALVLAGAFVLLTPATAEAVDLCNNTNGQAVVNMTSYRAMGCSFTKPVHVTEIVTYHWNNGKGKAPGTLALKYTGAPIGLSITPGGPAVKAGEVFGPYPAHGTSGQNGVPNVNWVADINLCLPAGEYEIDDSDWATWSMNAQSAYRGFVILRGDFTPCPTPTPAKTAPPPPVVLRTSSPLRTPTPAPSPTKSAVLVPLAKLVTPKPTATPAPKPTTKPTEKPTGKPTAKPTTKPTAKPTPKPAPTVNPALAAVKACFTNSGSFANVGPCFGAPGSTLVVRILNPAKGPFVGLQFRTSPAGGVAALKEAPLSGTGTIVTATVPTTLCEAPAPIKWDVYLLGGSAANPSLKGDIGQFSVTGCQNVTGKKSTLPTPVPGTPPPGLSAVKACFTNSGAVANVGPCFGPANSLLAVRILNPAKGPFTLLQFQLQVFGGGPGFVTSPLIGSGNLLWAKVPIQLCVAKSPAKWQVWIFNKTAPQGQIGQFTITGCP